MNWFKWFKKKNMSTGLVPQEHDDRDYKYKNRTTENPGLGVDLRDKFPPVTNQNGYASCTYHAVCALLDYNLRYKKQYTSWNMNTSEAYGWYYGRQMLGTENKNSGTVLRDAFKVIMKHGFVPQTFWDYKDGVYKEPDEKARMAASMFKMYLSQIKGYYAMGPDQVINALDNKCPVVFGMPTDSDYKSVRGGDPYVQEIDSSSGFHAQIIVGYNYLDNDIYYIVRNSWNNTWGVNGYVYLKKSVVDESGFDLWTLM